MNSIRNVIYYILCTLIFISACDSKMKEQPSELQKSGTETLFIKDILFNDNDVFLIADSIQFLTGEDAAKAYFEDKGKEIDEPAFYLRNKSVDDLKYEVGENVKIVVKTFDYLDEETKFADLFENNSEKYYSRLPFNISFSNGQVIKIEEIYIP